MILVSLPEACTPGCAQLMMDCVMQWVPRLLMVSPSDWDECTGEILVGRLPGRKPCETRRCSVALGGTRFRACCRARRGGAQTEQCECHCQSEREKRCRMWYRSVWSARPRARGRELSCPSLLVRQSPAGFVSQFYFVRGAGPRGGLLAKNTRPHARSSVTSEEGETTQSR